jgi:hypothetical protein
LREPVAALGRLLAAGLVGALACASDEPADLSAGSLHVEWTGADTGKLAAPAVAEWCDSLAFLEIRAIHGDTGIALLIYPSDSGADSVRLGTYPVVAPKRAARARPASAIAMRWFAETSIRGFSGDSGTVVLEAAGAGAGKLSAHLRSPSEGSRLLLTGSFKGLTVTPAPPGCAGAPPSATDEGQGADQDDEPDDFEDPDRNSDDPDQNDDDPD